MDDSGAGCDTLVATVERLLSRKYGVRVEVAGARRFPSTEVYRCTLEDGITAAPPSVIVRRLRTEPPRASAARLANERAALEFLDSLGCGVAPRYVAMDAAARILITEDFGQHPSLLDVLLGNDQEEARSALHGFARSLATLHAYAAGQVGAYNRCRGRLGPRDPGAEHPGTCPPLADAWQRVARAAADLRLPQSEGVNRDIAAIADTLAAPAGWEALSSGDASPVNSLVTPGGVRFVDFENAGFRHALVDAAVLRYPYPTGGPVWRLPADVGRSLEWEYRTVFGAARPAALNGDEYERGMAAACAAWTIERMARLPKVEAGPDRDAWPLVPPGWSGPFPTRSRRQQLVAIMDTCVESLQRARAFDALADWVDRTATALRTRWPETRTPVPLFPAFGGPADMPGGASVE